MPFSDPDRGRIERHLKELLASDEFRGAPKQSRALELMVRASIEGRDARGQDFAEALDGRCDERYVRAFRSLVREIRRSKLPAFYASRPESDVVFQLGPNDYRVAIELDGSGPTRRPLSPIPFSLKGRKKELALALFLVLVVFAVMALDSKTFFTEPPVRVVVEDETLRAYDRHGGRLPTIEQRALESVGFVPVEGVEDPLLELRLAALVIPDSPRGPGFLAVARYDPLRDDGTEVFFLESTTGLPLASLPLPYLPWDGARPDVLHDEGGDGEIPMDFPLASLARVELDGDGLRDEILVTIRSRESYPSQVLGLDLEGSLQVLVDYWHSGNVFSTVLPDTNADGVDEILVYGQDNGDQKASFVLLEPRPGRVLRARADGGRRGKMVREIREYPLAETIVRFPSTALHEVCRSTMRDLVYDPSWDPESRVLSLRVKDAGCDPRTGKDGRLAYELDLDTSRVSVDFESYDRYYRTLLEMIAAGGFADRFGIIETERLDGYARHLAEGVEWLDVTGEEPRWRPFADWRSD